MSSTRHQTRSGLLSRISLSSFRTKRRHSLQHGSTQQVATTVIFGPIWRYARKACDRTGARIHFAIHPMRFGPEHPHMKNYTRVAIPGLLPYLDDYIMGAHDPFVEFHWSMDDNSHTESKSPELTEGDVPNLLLFAPKEVINRVRSRATSSSEPAMRREELWPGRDQATQAGSQS